MSRKTERRTINPFQFEEHVQAAFVGVGLRSFLDIASASISLVLRERHRMKHMPPHFLLKAIDAACAYCPKIASRLATYQDLQQVVSLFQMQEENAKPRVLTELGLHSMFLQMSKEQFRIQMSEGVPDMGRAYRLLGDSNRLPLLDSVLRARAHFSLDDWFAVHMAAYGRLLSSGSFVLNESFLGQQWEGLLHCHDGHVRVLQEASHTSDQVGEEYRTRRSDNTKWQSHSYLLPSCYERPLISIGTAYYCPSPELLIDNAMLGLVRMKFDEHSRSAIDQEVHDAQVRYVCELLGIVWPHARVLTDDILKEIAGSKRHCDIAVVTQDWSLLIEAKTFRQVPTSVSASAMSRHGMTSALVDGLEQIQSAATMATNIAECAGVSQRPGASILGAVVTLQHVEFANSEWFRREVIDARGEFGADWNPLSFRPVVWDLRTLDLLAIHCANSGKFLPDLFAERESADFMWQGDWSTALAREVESIPKPLHAYWTEPLQEQLTKLSLRTKRID